MLPELSASNMTRYRHINLSQGPSWGAKLESKFLPWGSLCERTPLGKVVGNLAQAKTMVAHRTLFVFEKVL